MIRLAQEKDIKRIGELLLEVDLVHHRGRPDIFKIGRKYSDEELKLLLQDGNRPILVETDEDDFVRGYCFCVFSEQRGHSVLQDCKTLYIDDLCVGEVFRGRHIGKSLFDAAVSLAQENNCNNVTLNVWSCNTSAMKFYESCGLKPQKIGMELLL